MVEAIKSIQSAIGHFGDQISAIQLLLQQGIKMALALLAAILSVLIVRELLLWRRQARLEKQNNELLKSMKRIIALLEETLKKQL